MTVKLSVARAHAVTCLYVKRMVSRPDLPGKQCATKVKMKNVREIILLKRKSRK